jgi:hypothetical protein
MNILICLHDNDNDFTESLTPRSLDFLGTYHRRITYVLYVSKLMSCGLKLKIFEGTVSRDGLGF